MKSSTRHILVFFMTMLAMALNVAGQTPSSPVTQITGLVRDSLTHDGIPYASISLMGTSEGTLATDRGGFTVNSRARFSKLRVTAMGYKPKEVEIKPGQGSVVLIDLVAAGVELDELVVRKGKEKYSKKDNPAVEMIKRLRQRRDVGDPRRHPHYGYSRYERMMLGLGNLDDIISKPEEQQWINQYADTSLLTGKRVLPISIKETVARDYYGDAGHKQVILGTRSAGIDERIDQENVKKILDDFMGEIDIFQNDVTLLTNRFVSPLSRIAVDFYKFYLNDTVDVDGERCAVLSFVPFTPQTFGFLGRLYVSLEDSTMFIKRVEMGVPYDINLNYVERMSIVQDFERAADGVTRLKVRDNVEVSFKIMPGVPEAFARRETSYRDHNFERPEGSVFNFKGEQASSNGAAFMPDEFWQEYRPAHVRTTAATMQGLMKRLRGSKLFYWAEQVIVMMVNGYIPTARVSKVDLGPLNTLVSGNSLEGLRLRLGGMTNVNLSRHWFARGYAAYGFRDKKFKYMGSLEYSFIPKKAMDQEFPIHSLRLTHRYDVDKLAQHYLYTNQDNMFLTLRRHKDVRMQYLRTTRLEYRHEWYNHFSIALGIEHNVHEATQYVPFIYGDGTSRQRYTQAGFTAQLRFAPGETFYQARSYRIPINMDAPIITLTQTYMPKGFMGSLHEVNKTELGLQKRFWFSAFGYADVIVKGEKIWSQVAYPDLLMPNVNLSYTIQPESFALMKPMEFINDQALSWDLTYWGNGILMNRLPLIKRLRLREVLTLRGLWGSLSDKNDPTRTWGLFRFPDDVPCQPMGGKPYIEAGVGLDNILTVLRIDYVWRLTYRDHAGTDRHGIRIQLHFNF
ncbi:MAG: carboxypeptidase-like regulatory domain-containing protein [Muribaculaceae bacterium]|nr:carboxypeptidase-like regulatory domain-containing protein [Muribaculaceae bacterium]